jgi:hypothetical protein
MLAQSLAMATGSISSNPNKCFDGNRPNLCLLAKKLDPYTMGISLSSSLLSPLSSPFSASLPRCMLQPHTERDIASVCMWVCLFVCVCVYAYVCIRKHKEEF